MVKVKDFTLENYCNSLWISDLLKLKQNSTKTFLHLSPNVSFEVNNVTIFGTIIEVKKIQSSGYLYYVDDGTGVIVCKHNDQQFAEIFDVVEDEYTKALGQRAEFSRCAANQSNQSTFNESDLEDTIFNDKTIQLDELNSLKRNQLIGLQSLWSDLMDSFSGVIKQYEVGNTVLIHGRVYSFIHINQIYINCIRGLNLKEEIIRIMAKLEDNKRSVSASPVSSVSTFLLPKPVEALRRRSGAMTFDHIHHTDMKSHPMQKTFSTPKRMMEETEGPPRKRLSIVSPKLDTLMTFDTLVNPYHDISYDGNETM